MRPSSPIPTPIAMPPWSAFGVTFRPAPVVPSHGPLRGVFLLAGWDREDISGDLFLAFAHVTLI